MAEYNNWLSTEQQRSRCDCSNYLLGARTSASAARQRRECLLL